MVVSWFADRAQVVTWAGEATPDPLTPDWLIGEIGLADKHHYSLLAGEKAVVGFFALLAFPEEKRVHLTRVGVSPDLQGHGLGRRIVSESLAAGRDLGARILTLSVYTSNVRAFEIYQRAGFRTSEPQPTPQDIPDPLVRMEFAL